MVNGDRKLENHARSKDLTEERVAAFLNDNPEFLERYVMEELEIEQLERWIIRRTQRDKKRAELNVPGSAGRKTSLSRWKFCVHADKRQMLQDLTQSLQQRPSVVNVLSELASCISSAVSADGYRLYLPDNDDDNHLCLYLGYESNDCQRLGKALLPCLVAKTKEPMRLSKGDPNFPAKGSGDIAHLLLEPLVQPDGQLVAVLEMWRLSSGPGPFHEEDEEIATSYIVWGGIALHYAKLYMSMSKQRKLSDFLLAVVKQSATLPDHLRRCYIGCNVARSSATLPDLLQGFRIVCNVARSSGRLPDRLQGCQIVCKVARSSATLPDRLQRCQIVWKVAGSSATLPDRLEGCRIVCKVARSSVTLPDRLQCY
ncbi:cAMP and cAMP-inhibited cGMP 3',5'-cyclic phosphodiesterase [Nesidiocoris tenuis]|uniref:cAMP and cAMP-inhibited cGMP 3',5'-cyclic phosphodiesterase n=1 Tax=Nesidiocoris tenuis TaxID=355587 RepID=A0ABN7BDJ6_9HEMI|nr:cAMP and cAMP-inhibited cGMP 3',5'-cyclic phosphodiesterase [Nesidiocoris tenuis]